MSSDPETEPDHQNAGGKGRGSKKQASLQHVPCRFYRQGICAAGASCPFSHQAAEPGQTKGVCQWYLKGNCKFGHKCALAHVLPGQPMSMDRKNKRAEQTAAQGKAPSSGRDKGDRPERETKRVGSERRDSKANGSDLAAPSTGRPSMSSRPPMMIGKAAATVSATESVNSLRDTDFRQPDEGGRRGLGVGSFAAAAAAGTNQQKSTLSTSAHPPPGLSSSVSASNLDDSEAAANNSTSSPANPPVSNPAPSAEHSELSPRKLSPIPQSRPVHRSHPSSDRGFGPIGSPPSTSLLKAQSPPTTIPLAPSLDLNHSAGSPRNYDFQSSSIFGTSPFSTPNSKSIFLPYGQGGSVPALSQIHTRLPATESSAASNPSTTWTNGNGVHRGSLPATAFLGGAIPEGAFESAVDMEEALPSSLSDLLSPDERSRRMSRTTGRPTFDTTPKFAQSVPATSLLHNVRTLWADRATDLGNVASPPRESWIGNHAEPYGRTEGFQSGSFVNRSDLSSGLNRLSSFDAHQRGIPSSLSHPTTDFSQLSLMSTPLPPTATSSSFVNPSLGQRDPQQDASLFGLQPYPQRPSAANKTPSQLALSPSSRALRSHEPGQSLPQGLAAGLSRLHFIPATNPISPPPLSGSPHSHFQQQQSSWSAQHGLSALHSEGTSVTNAVHAPNANTTPTPEMAGLPSSLRRPWAPHAASSPLSRPSVAPANPPANANANEDDDTLFAMDCTSL